MIGFANLYTDDLAGGRSANHEIFLLGVLPPYTTSRDWVWDQRVSQYQELLRILKLTRSAIPLSSVGDPWHCADPDPHLLQFFFFYNLPNLPAGTLSSVLEIIFFAKKFC